jgi:hypothetical protein
MCLDDLSEQPNLLAKVELEEQVKQELLVVRCSRGSRLRLRHSGPHVIKQGLQVIAQCIAWLIPVTKCCQKDRKHRTAAGQAFPEQVFQAPVNQLTGAIGQGEARAEGEELVGDKDRTKSLVTLELAALEEGISALGV